jgi:hypothetical protein
MTKLVQRGAVPIDGLEIRLRPRHLYEIVRWAVEGAITAHAKVRAGRGDQRIGVGQDEAVTVRHRCGSAGHFRRGVLALIGVEHRKPLEKWDRVRFIAVALGALAFVFGYKAVGINDCGAVLALSDISAEA